MGKECGVTPAEPRFLPDVTQTEHGPAFSGAADLFHGRWEGQTPPVVGKDAAPRALARVVQSAFHMMNEQRHSTSGGSLTAKHARRSLRAPAKRRYSVGELVTAAYKNAEQLTRDRQVVAVIASQTLATWLARSNHPEVIAQLRALAS